MHNSGQHIKKSSVEAISIKLVIMAAKYASAMTAANVDVIKMSTLIPNQRST
jgi:hypothetical protein